MIKEILTEWQPTVHTRPANVTRKDYANKLEGLMDHNVHARVVKVQIEDPTLPADEYGEPATKLVTAIEHKVVAERDSQVCVIKPHVAREYNWMKKRFTLQFEQLEGRTIGKAHTGTPLVDSGVVPEGVLPAFLREGINTVESLAYMTDQTARKFGPNTGQWRQRALDYVNNPQAAAAKRIGRPPKKAEAEAA